MCIAPPTLWNGSVQANNRSLYVEGDVVNCRRLCGLSPACVIIATCTMEGSWRPDPQLQNFSSTTEDTSTTSASTSTQGMQL